MMILIAGPYRSGTGDDPEKMAANVRLMEQPKVDVRGLEARRPQDLLRRIMEQPHGPLEHRASVHFHKPIVGLYAAAIEWYARAAGRAN